MVTPVDRAASANNCRKLIEIGSANEICAAIPSPKHVWVARWLVRLKRKRSANGKRNVAIWFQSTPWLARHWRGKQALFSFQAPLSFRAQSRNGAAWEAAT